MNDAIAFADILEDVALQLSSLDPLAEEPEAIAATAASVVAEYQRLGTSRQHVSAWMAYSKLPTGYTDACQFSGIPP